VTSATALDADTAQYTISGITTEMPVNISVGALKLTDAFGNPNTPFTASYQGDRGTLDFPNALTAADPQSSLI